MFNFKDTYRHLPTALFAESKPQQATNPKVLIVNNALATSLDLKDISETADLAAILSGTKLLPDSTPIATAYAGHQFGHLTKLGDGRAILLGEHLTTTNQRFDIQLKGSGRTVYSRNGDGKATVKAMLREYLMSESMYALGVPTTRSLAVVTTGEDVRREEWYKGAVLTRVAASHVRVGTFEYIRYFGNPQHLQVMCDYVIQRHYPQWQDSPNKALALLEAVMASQANLISEWMRVGFIHGVMNTDNTSICGETIDYGPCAFLNAYKLDTVYSSIDEQGRYAFGNQANIIFWNLVRFAESLLPIIANTEKQAIDLANEVLQTFQARYQQQFYTKLLSKIGIAYSTDEADKALINDLLSWMEHVGADYTNTFLAIEGHTIPTDERYTSTAFLAWHKRWQTRLGNSVHSKEVKIRLRRANPLVIPRAHLVEEALDRAANHHDLELFNTLLQQVQQTDATLVNPQFMAPPDTTFDNNYATFCGT